MSTIGGSRIFRDVQAPPRAITYSRRRERATDELTGLCKGLLADGILQDSEARFLIDWLRAHSEFEDEYPFNILIAKIEDALIHGVLDQDEEKDLIDLMLKVAGNPHASIAPAAPAAFSSLPIDYPQPPVAFNGRIFVLAGVFDYGPRSLVVDAIERRGGSVAANISRELGFLVVGNLGSDDWVHSSFGRKIEQAVALKKECPSISIISEQHWREALSS